MQMTVNVIVAVIWNTHMHNTHIVDIMIIQNKLLPI